MTTTSELWQLIEPYLAAEKLELYDLELSGQGRGRVLRVAIEGEDVDIDRLSQVSRAISRMLDNDADIDGSYQLEVTTPGLERKLRRPDQFARSVGREIVAKVQAAQTKRTIRGVLSGVDTNTFTVESDTGPETVRFDDVVKANTVFRWEKAPKPGH